MNLYLFLGYAVFWTVLFLYVVMLHRQQLRLNRELREMEKILDEQDSEYASRISPS